MTLKLLLCYYEWSGKPEGRCDGELTVAVAGKQEVQDPVISGSAGRGGCEMGEPGLTNRCVNNLLVTAP